MSPRATALIRRIEAGEMSVRLTDQVVFETGFTLERSYKISKLEIRTLLLAFIQLPNVILPDKQWWEPALSLYASTKLSLVDAYHVILMQREGIAEIISFDTDFDAIPTIARTEP
jgi:predicted nucleic acid-binding protein